METLRIVWNTRSLKSSPETSTKPGEREARHVLFYQNYQLRVEVEEHQRQARYAPGRPVQESSQNCDLMMVQALPSLQDRLEGQVKDRERRVTHVIASEAQKAFFMKTEKSYTTRKANTLSRWREEIRVLQEPDPLGHAVASCEISRKLCTNRRHSKSRVSKA